MYPMPTRGFEEVFKADFVAGSSSEAALGRLRLHAEAHAGADDAGRALGLLAVHFCEASAHGTLAEIGGQRPIGHPFR